MFSRIAKVRNKLKELSLDALFITTQTNVSYLTGFSGLSQNEREGFLLITRKNAYLFTFPTYFGLYHEDREDFTSLLITQSKRLTDHLNELIKKENIKSVGFEEENLTLAEFDSLKKKVSVKWINTNKIVENLRIIKNDDELKNIKKAAQIADIAFNFIKSKIRKGKTEKDIALDLEFFIKKNADDTAFPPIVAFDKNAAIPHYLPSRNQQLTINNLILLDFGARVNNYCSDMTRVISYGKLKAEQIKAYQTVLNAQNLAFKTINYCFNDINHCSRKEKGGILGKELDKTVRKYIKEQGFPEYPHGLGHGVGINIHEDPRLKIDSADLLKPGMVFTIEPGIYLSGRYGIRIEDLVVLKENGIEILTKSPKTLTVIY